MRILCVDDDLLIRESTGDMLRELKHDVYEAPDGTLALEWLARCKFAVDLLITDVRMPRMTGFALARKAAEHNPELSVIFMTGYGEGLAAPGPVLRKPFSFGKLREAIARVR